MAGGLEEIAAAEGGSVQAWAYVAAGGVGIDSARLKAILTVRALGLTIRARKSDQSTTIARGAKEDYQHRQQNRDGDHNQDNSESLARFDSVYLRAVSGSTQGLSARGAYLRNCRRYTHLSQPGGRDQRRSGGNGNARSQRRSTAEPIRGSEEDHPVFRTYTL